jgi:hypothetical protein
MVEGWAVYTERMMIEAGYGNSEPEMLLMYNKWHLRTVCNTILDYSVHVKGWKKEDAIHLLVDEAFQQQAEAEGKWKRVQLSQVQLCSYFPGYSEIYALREEMKKKVQMLEEQERMILAQASRIEQEIKQFKQEKQRADHEQQRADHEQQRAEQEQQRADQEKQRADHEKSEKEKLIQKLKELGIDPDAI